MKRAAFLSPAVFGAFDGSTSVIGVLLTLTGHPAQVLPTAFGLAVAGGVGMAAGQWLSQDTDAGLADAIVIGAATAIGTVLPAVPYALLGGTAAIAASAVVLILLGTVITAVRAHDPDRTWARAAAETYGVLLAVCAAVAICTLATGASG